MRASPLWRTVAFVWDYMRASPLWLPKQIKIRKLIGMTILPYLLVLVEEFRYLKQFTSTKKILTVPVSVEILEHHWVLSALPKMRLWRLWVEYFCSLH